MANPLGLAVVSLMVMFAPASLAGTARVGESALDPVVELMSTGSFSGSFETACFDSVEILSARLHVTEMPLLDRQSARATEDDTTAAPQDKPARPTLQDAGPV